MRDLLRSVESIFEPLHHRPLLGADGFGDFDRMRIGSGFGKADQHFVARPLHGLVSVGVRHEPTGSLGHHTRKQEEAFSSELHHRILEQRRGAAVGFEPRPNQLCLLLRFEVVLTKCLGQNRGAGEIGRSNELSERLLLDRIHITEEFDELLLGSAGHGSGRKVPLIRAA